MSSIFRRETKSICASDDAVENDSEKGYRNKAIFNDFLRRSEKGFVATCIWYSSPLSDHGESLSLASLTVRLRGLRQTFSNAVPLVIPIACSSGIPLSGPYGAIPSKRIFKRSKRTAYAYIKVAER